MTHVVELNAKVREVTGKTSHKLAAEGLVPAVVYGPNVDTRSVSVSRREFDHLMQSATVGATLVELSVEGDAKPVDVIIKEVKRDELKGFVQHVDFWAVDMAQSIQTVVSVTFVGTSEGERAGGVLMHSLRELKVEANPKDLPEHIELDVSALQVGDSLTVADIVAPKGVTLLDEPESVLVSVMAPMGEEALEPTAEETVEVPEIGEDTEGTEE
ncbi:MAG: 50S ribosomal protein L25 [Coriobacteriia bacterium]|nr:50S ribosomal protein L25 [Coriobacteriia bacterium]MBN2841165.1 50S ribosomal protein L25 [Coriobacteriia bacterium]